MTMNNAPAPERAARLSRGPFEPAYTPARHFRLALYATLAHAIEAFADGDIGAAVAACPFLEDYVEEMQGGMQEAGTLAARWRTALREWEAQAQRAGVHLPLLAVRRCGLGELETELWLAAGLIEEDPRLAVLYEQVQRHAGRASFGLLTAWWRDRGDGADRVDEIRQALFRLIDLGLLQVANPEAPRPDWALLPTLAAWD